MPGTPRRPGTTSGCAGTSNALSPPGLTTACCTRQHARALLWADDVASAEAELERAIALGPRDIVLDWMLHRAEDFRYEGRPPDTRRLLDRVITVRPDDWLTYARRAEMLSFVGRDSEFWGDAEHTLPGAGTLRS